MPAKGERSPTTEPIEMMRPPFSMSGAAVRTANIDRKEAVELGKIVGTVMHLIGREHAGIVDQNVEAAEALDHQFHQSLDFLGIGLVGPEGVGAYAFGQQVVDHVLGLIWGG